MSETLHSIMQSNKFTLCRRLGVERIKPVPLNYELVPFLYHTVTSAHLNEIQDFRPIPVERYQPHLRNSKSGWRCSATKPSNPCASPRICLSSNIKYSVLNIQYFNI